jgi:hypothetical protein
MRIGRRTAAGEFSMPDPHPSAYDRQWFIVGRWQEYGGEARANLLRLLAIAVFYSLQLAHHYLLSAADQRDANFHRAASALAVAGLFVTLAVQLCLQRHVFPSLLKYVSTAADIVLLTGLAALGSGPHSPLLLAYFLIIAMAALRFSLRLVWFASLGSMLGYLTLVGLADKSWFDANHAVRPIDQLFTLASLALNGIVIGQAVRQVRSVAEDYRQRAARAA